MGAAVQKTGWRRSNRNRTTMEPSNPTSEYLSERIQVAISEVTLMFVATLFTASRNWK